MLLSRPQPHAVLLLLLLGLLLLLLLWLLLLLMVLPRLLAVAAVFGGDGCVVVAVADCSSGDSAVATCLLALNLLSFSCLPTTPRRWWSTHARAFPSCKERRSTRSPLFRLNASAFLFALSSLCWRCSYGNTPTRGRVAIGSPRRWGS